MVVVDMLAEEDTRKSWAAMRDLLPLLARGDLEQKKVG